MRGRGRGSSRAGQGNGDTIADRAEDIQIIGGAREPHGVPADVEALCHDEGRIDRLADYRIISQQRPILLIRES
jgi:hypothetical protein